MSGLILNFFKRAVPGRALRSAALTSNLTRVANVLNTIQGEGCVIRKPLLNEGLGWTIDMSGGSSDMEADQLPDVMPDSRPIPFHILHFPEQAGAAAHWEVMPGPVLLNGTPVSWDDTRWPAYQDLHDGDDVYLVIYEKLKDIEPPDPTVTDPERLLCGLYSAAQSPVSENGMRCAHLIGSLASEGGVQCFEGALVLSDFHGDDNNSITPDTQGEVFSCVSNGEKTLPDPKEPVDPNAPGLDLVVRSYHLAEDTFRHDYIGWRALLRDATEGVTKLIVEKLVQHPELPPADMFIQLIREWWEKQEYGYQPSTSTWQEKRWPVGTLLVGTPYGNWKRVADAIEDGSAGLASAVDVDTIAENADKVQTLLDAVNSEMLKLQERMFHMRESLDGNDQMMDILDEELKALRELVANTDAELSGAKGNVTAARSRLVSIFKRIDKLKQP